MPPLHQWRKTVIDFSTTLKNSPPLKVHAYWDPIADATYNLHKNSPENMELFDLSPNETVREYKGDAFNAFLPSSAVAVGDVWELDRDSVIPFLLQFHPGAMDIQVLSPEAEVIMHQPDKDLPDKNRTEYYLTLLASAAKGEVAKTSD